MVNILIIKCKYCNNNGIVSQSDGSMCMNCETSFISFMSRKTN